MQKHSIRVIAFRPEWVDVLGDIESAVFYQQIAYWSDKGAGEDGWIYKSVPEIEYETTLTDRQQRRVIKNLVAKGLLGFELRKAPNGRVTRYFKVAYLQEPGIAGHPLQKVRVPLTKRKGSPDETSDHTYTEITTENTQNILAIPPESTDVSKVIGFFKAVNPAYKKLFGNTTQRAAAERLLKLFPIGELEFLITKVLPAYNADKYSKGKPITSLQFEDNLGHIKSWTDRKQQEQAKKDFFKTT